MSRVNANLVLKLYEVKTAPNEKGTGYKATDTTYKFHIFARETSVKDNLLPKSDYPVSKRVRAFSISSADAKYVDLAYVVRLNDVEYKILSLTGNESFNGSYILQVQQVRRLSDG